MSNHTVSPSVIVTTYIVPTINIDPICDTNLSNRIGDLPLQQQIKRRKRISYGQQKNQKRKFRVIPVTQPQSPSSVDTTQRSQTTSIVRPSHTSPPSLYQTQDLSQSLFFIF